MFKNIKAAIFDMDGTLIDSMWVWENINKEYFKKINITIPKNLKETIENMTFDEIAKYFKKNFNLTNTIEEIKNEWNNMALYHYSHNVKLKQGVKKYLTLLKAKGIKIALATSNCKFLLEAVLKNNNIYHFFDSITTIDEVKRGKNFPDIYLLTAKKLNVKPEECIVFEDILPAIIGAKSAGMTVIGVHDNSSEYQKDKIKNIADFYIFNYNDFTKAV